MTGHSDGHRRGAHWRALAFGLAGAGLLAAPQALAQEDGTGETEPSRIEALEQQIESLRDEVERLKETRAPAEPEVQSAVEETRMRVESLEDEVSRIDRQVGSRAVVNAFDAASLNIGGFLDLAAKHVNGEDRNVTSFNRQVAELLVQADLAPDWEMFWAQSFLRKQEPDFSDTARPDIGNLNNVETDTVLAWANYRHSDLVQVKAGRFVTPHGIVNIEHFPATLLDPDQPQFLRPFSGQTIFPNFTDGFQLHGSVFTSDALDAGQISYNLYTGNFAGNATEFNVGGRLEYAVGGTGLTLGANLTYGDRSSNEDADYIAFGGDILYDAGPIIWKTEAFGTDEDMGGDRYAAYTQPGYRLTDKLTAFYRLDYLEVGDPNIFDADVDTDRAEGVEHVVGLNYQFHKNVRLRSILRRNQFDTGDDAHTVELSATLSY